MQQDSTYSMGRDTKVERNILICHGRRNVEIGEDVCMIARVRERYTKRGVKGGRRREETGKRILVERVVGRVRTTKKR